MSIAAAGRIRMDMCSSLVCMDVSSDYEMSGRVFHLYMEDPFDTLVSVQGNQMGGRVYRSFLELIDILDEIYDRLDYPQNSVDYRSFSEKTQHEICRECIQESNLMGMESTFLVRVLFRQNASWQGSIKWIEKNRTENFRSVMELMKLIRSTQKKEVYPDDLNNTLIQEFKHAM